MHCHVITVSNILEEMKFRDTILYAIKIITEMNDVNYLLVIYSLWEFILNF